jgi:tRNA modification GTPase
MGIARTREQLNKAAFVLLLQAPDTDPEENKAIEEEIRNKGLPYLKIHTKADILFPTEPQAFALSAQTGEGMERLKTEIVNRAVDRTMLEAETSLITNLRHYEALGATDAALEQVEKALRQGLTGDLLATDIREALFHLGSITGEITVEEVLGSIFTRFCIGK